jgi:CheY-like chemotaxis protein
MNAEKEDYHRQVMVADDDHEDFYAFQIACEELTYKVLLLHVDNSVTMMERLDQELPDILFLDIMFQPISGTTCLRELRSNRKYDQLPIIMYTSMGDLQNIEFCFKEGANLYLLKPTTFKGLREALQRILTISWKQTMYYPTRDSFVLQVN